MAIPSVMQGLIEVEGGKVFELDSLKGSAWLESVVSFRYEPRAANKPYTVRKEAGKGGDYWYGYRKQNGKLHKKYIGRSSEVNTAKLEEVAEALNMPSPPRVTDKVTQVTDKVTDTCNADRLTALELQVKALQESLEALRRELPGKSELGNFEKLPIVTDIELQTKIGNLELENAELRRQAAAVQAEREDLAQFKKQAKEAAAEVHREGMAIKGLEIQWQQRLTDARGELADAKAVILQQGNRIRELERGFSLKPSPVDVATMKAQRLEIGDLKAELADLKQKSATASKDLPEAADILNQLKAKRKKSKTDLADLEAILEILEN